MHVHKTRSISKLKRIRTNDNFRRAFFHLCHETTTTTTPSTMTIIVSIVIIMTSTMLRCYLFTIDIIFCGRLFSSFHFFIWHFLRERRGVLRLLHVSVVAAIAYGLFWAPVFSFALHLGPCSVHFFSFWNTTNHKKQKQFPNSFSFDHKNKQCMHEYNTHNYFGLRSLKSWCWSCIFRMVFKHLVLKLDFK